MNNIIVTIKKELRSIFRDKKTLRTLFILPIFIPLFIIFYGYIFDTMNSEAEELTKIGVNYKLDGIDNLYKDNLIDNVYGTKEELEKKYEKEEIDGYILLENNKYYIYVNSESTSGAIASEKAVAFLESYNNYLGVNYLIENKIDPTKVYNNIDYEIVEKTADNYLLNLIISIAITYTILSIAMAASSMALSSTVSEKENGTLETILTLPIKTTELLTGKLLASTVMGIIVSMFSFILTYTSIKIGADKFESFETFSIKFSALDFISIILVLIVASLLISGIAFALTAMTKTTKEAQSKTQLLSMITMIPMFLSLANVDLGMYLYFVPICNYVQILMDIFNGIHISYGNLLITLVTSIVYIVIILNIIVRLYKSEKVLFTN